MKEAYLLVAFFLTATAVAGLVKTLLSTGKVEKLLALQLLVTTAVAVFLLLSAGFDVAALRDVALVTGLLTAIAAVAFIRYGSFKSEPQENKNE